MLVYKYRGGNFERDLLSLENNYYWASNFDQLNDATENAVGHDLFLEQLAFINSILRNGDNESKNIVESSLKNLLSHNKRMGIYSLSKTYLNELLWAHYGNSHKGFCIEYNKEELLKSLEYENPFPFKIKYKKIPPEIDILDMLPNKNNIIRKIAGVKSKRWKYEKEFRIVHDDYGNQFYNYNAVKSIYFGLRMIQEEKTELINRLKGRGIKYFQIERLDKTYNFTAKEIIDHNGDEKTYLTQIPNSITKHKPIKFEITKQKFFKLNLLGEIEIRLESIINNDEIFWLANTVKNIIFQTATRIFISYYIEGQKDDFIPWATSNFADNKFEIKINDYHDL
ncbi:DUF2971 domain-containing protein [Flavobacterium caeni]|uniref:DUF2971 domain-containing protein n=1 Tax=Flavobacterium caeni TaxID=490189 RepID=A0A1G5KDF3_9FLAO|nr:DUF2971 domain-containing protein [Flavobacterium caeni]SCY98009.1 Protein of unknown function [Flavobacterium caeni]